MSDAWMIMAGIIFALVSSVAFVGVTALESQEDHEQAMLEEIKKFLSS